jgi:hypothetical protein
VTNGSSSVAWIAALRLASGTPLTGAMASHAAWSTKAVLRRVGAFTDERDFDRRERPTPDGVTFAAQH